MEITTVEKFASVHPFKIKYTARVSQSWSTFTSTLGVFESPVLDSKYLEPIYAKLSNTKLGFANWSSCTKDCVSI